MWAERYDLDLKDIFALQDEVRMKIFSAMEIKLTEGEYARLLAKGTDKLETYIMYLQARKNVRGRTKERNALGQRNAKGAIAGSQSMHHLTDYWLLPI